MPGVSGQVAAPNTADELIGIGMWSLGYDWNSEDEAQIREGADVMKEFAKHVKSYEAGPVDGMVSGQFVMGAMSHGAARNARIQDPKLKFVVPGPQTEIWVDTYIMPKGAPSPDQAYSFISYMMEPERQIADTAYIGYPTGLPDEAARMPKSVKLADEIFVTPEILERTSSRIVNPKTQGLVAQLYNEITGGS
jgi:spermidine/putrescine transport system substrate-binding protein